jgi:glycosyltransferase involved in cell wall biosynthesis
VKIVHLSYSERSGGASIAMHRLYRGQRAAGLDARLLVLRKASADPHVTAITLNRLQATLRHRLIARERPSRAAYPAYDGRQWSNGALSTPVPRHVASARPDVLHLHWIGDGLLSIPALAGLDVPLVWTLHDQWAFTGGCHFSGDCTRYEAACGACPALGSTRDDDLSRAVWQRKRDGWQGLRVTFVAPSAWMAARLTASSLIRDARVEVIPNGVDLTVFSPRDRTLAREVFGLPPESKLILFGAQRVDDPRKGLHHLQAALTALNGRDDIALAVYGAGEVNSESTHPIYHVGVINDDRLMALLYAAADVFVAPSEHDNLPNTVVEALACGTPCAAFDVGGLPELIADGLNGALIAPYDTAALAQGIAALLDGDHGAQRAAARDSAVRRYDLQAIVARMSALYASLTQP